MPAVLPIDAVALAGVTVSVPSGCTAVTVQVSRLATSALESLLRVAMRVAGADALTGAGGGDRGAVLAVVDVAGGHELLADRGVEGVGFVVGGHGDGGGPALAVHRSCILSYVST